MHDEHEKNQQLPAPVERTEESKKGWLASITPANAKKVIHAIGYMVGTVSKVSDSVAAKVRDNRSRDAISQAVTERIATGIRGEDPRYERAFQREADRLLREQDTIDDIAQIATEQLSERTEADFSKAEVDDDWLYQFEAAAKGFSSERMKHTFARILAGEILQPGTFSPATLRALTTLDQLSAQKLRAFAGMAHHLGPIGGPFAPPRLLDLGRVVGSNGLAEFGFSYDVLDQMRQAGLVAADLSSYVDMVRPWVVRFGLQFGARTYATEDQNPADTGSVRFNGVRLSQVGAELFKVVEPDRMPEAYEAELMRYANDVWRLKLMPR